MLVIYPFRVYAHCKQGNLSEIIFFFFNFQEAFQRLFAEYGKVENVYFHKKPTSGPPQQAKYPHFSNVTPVTVSVLHVYRDRMNVIITAISWKDEVLKSSKYDKPFIS